jgi:hypothetical protein
MTGLTQQPIEQQSPHQKPPQQPSAITGFSIDRFKKLYQPFNATSLGLLDQVYSEDLVFKDPVHQLHGLTELHSYFSGFCTPEVYCEFEFLDQLTSDSQAFFHWRMHYRHPRLNAGQPLTLKGASLIKFNERIFYHEDFYDMGAMIYQHLPLVGWLVKKINTRIAGTPS